MIEVLDYSTTSEIPPGRYDLEFISLLSNGYQLMRVKVGPYRGAIVVIPPPYGFIPFRSTVH